MASDTALLFRSHLAVKRYISDVNKSTNAGRTIVV